LHCHGMWGARGPEEAIPRATLWPMTNYDGSAATDADAGRPSRTPRSLLRWLATIALITVAVPALARAFSVEAGPLAIVLALMPWVALAALIPLLLALVARAWWLAGASAAVLAQCVGWLAPLYIAESRPDEGGEFTVASLNMTFGQVNADAVVEWVADHQVDVLSAQEVTPQAVEALARAGLDELLPHSQVAAEPGVTGTGLWSRTPLANAESLSGFTGPGSRYTSRAARGDVEVAPGAVVTVIAVHPAAPGLMDHSAWSASLDSMTDYLAQQEGPMLVVGDFNTTRDHRAFRDLQNQGFIDAADQAGAGFAPTFPQGRGPFPVAAIDHALARDAPLTATRVSTHALAGADHRGIVVTYVVHEPVSEN